MAFQVLNLVNHHPAIASIPITSFPILQLLNFDIAKMPPGLLQCTSVSFKCKGAVHSEILHTVCKQSNKKVIIVEEEYIYDYNILYFIFGLI